MKHVPVSALKNDIQALANGNYREPAILTKNGRAQHAFATTDERETHKATLRLLEELQKGYQSLHSEGSILAKDFLKELENDFKQVHYKH
ncbi:prevent-host-death protein [Streptococcus sp. NLN64]|uniref:prevent-host-death protein n=1 Tax=Streptococcus sp. NLN64 TaxID=2822799 RepID=UPI0018CAFD06|nr:prevent-host-death protein [Streptococcus sp. NLN64]MBG9367962.1 prevent-host-death protein [Streptococcus sp. NLN64]